MCEPKAMSAPASDGSGGYDINVTCEISGKPITISNKYGMYCEDMCGYEEDKALGDDFEDVFAELDEDMDDDEQVLKLMNGLHDIFKKHLGDDKNG